MREPPLSLQPSPSTQGAPKKGPKATASWQGKAAIRAYTKPFLVWHFRLKCVLHLGFYSNWEVPILAQLDGVKQPGEWSRSAGDEDRGQEGKKPKIIFLRSGAALSASILVLGLLQLGQDSNPVPLSPGAVQPAGAKSEGVKHQLLGSLQVWSSLLCPTLVGPGMAASSEPLYQPGLK